MQTLQIDPASRFLIPAATPISILLVGCGGTGSHIAQSLARLAYHVRELGGPPLSLAFLDGDTVEPKNVGRQLFSLADVGRNKAQALAARLSAVFGLRIAAIPEMLATQVGTFDDYGVVVGAVDGPEGRRAMEHLLAWEDWRLWLDAGNERHDGQVAVGNVTTPARLAGAFAVPGLCAGLPAPSLTYPDLLADAPPEPAADCADAMQTDAQSLMVNQAMAAVVGQYLYQIVVSRGLTTFATSIDLSSLSMRSLPITPSAVSQATGVSLNNLLGLKTKRTRVKARAS